MGVKQYLKIIGIYFILTIIFISIVGVKFERNKVATDYINSTQSNNATRYETITGSDGNREIELRINNTGFKIPLWSDNNVKSAGWFYEGSTAHIIVEPSGVDEQSRKYLEQYSKKLEEMLNGQGYKLYSQGITRSDYGRGNTVVYLIKQSGNLRIEVIY